MERDREEGRGGATVAGPWVRVRWAKREGGRAGPTSGGGRREAGRLGRMGLLRLVREGEEVAGGELG